MFELHTSAFGRFRRYDFSLPTTGHSFSIVPARGATVIDLRYRGESLLDGYATPEALEAGEWAKSALLFPFPNRLRDGRYQWGGQEYQFPINEPKTNTAIHGFASREPFAVTRIELTEEHAEITCRLDYTGHHAGYPFPLTMEVTYSLTYRGLFGLSVWVKNRHTAAIPIGLGWHPYFRLAERTDVCQLKCPPCDREILDKRGLPARQRELYTAFEQTQLIGETGFDDCFRVNEHLTLYDLRLKGPRHAITLSLSRVLFPFFQLFIPPHRQSIAIEPMSCLVNAFENGEGLISLAPSADWSAAFVLQCEAV